MQHLFPPADGWKVVVDIDAMERAIGTQHPPDKKEKVARAEAELLKLGVRLGAHEVHGRVDISALHPEKGHFLIEAEGHSSKQKEQAKYSALGQTVLMMGIAHRNITYALAVPDMPEWERQIQKIPQRVMTMLNIKCFLVSNDGVREF